MAPEWIALGVSAAAVLVSVAATIYGRGQRDAAVRQAAAAEAQVEYMRRQVALMERDAAAAEQRSAGSIANPVVRDLVMSVRRPYVPPWSVVGKGRHGFRLVNGGTESAYDVSLAFDVEPSHVDPTHWDEISARASRDVMMWRGIGGSPDTVTVRWRRQPDGELMEWTTGLH